MITISEEIKCQVKIITERKKEMAGAYNQIQTICIYPQGYCCDNTDCRLYNRCSVLPKGKKITKNKYLLLRIKPITYKEYREHHKLYDFYNYMFGNGKTRHQEWQKQNHDILMARQKERREKKRKEYTSVLYKKICDMNCEECPYPDCKIPIIENQKEYQHLYYQLFKEKRIETSKKYYEENKEKVKAQKKEYYNKNREKILEKARQDYKNGKYKYYQEHRDEINAKRRERRKLKKEGE